jgi:putative transposase
MSTTAVRANGTEARHALFLKTIPTCWRDFENWPVPPQSSVKEKHRDRFKRLCKGARLFLLGQPMAEVLEAAGVGERQFFDLMRVALQTRRDGTSIEGARAFIHCKVQPARVREAKQRAFEQTSAGFGGLFGKFLREHREILVSLEGHISGSKSPMRMTPTLLHAAFLRIVKAAGVRDDQYPLNTVTQAKSALWNWYQAVYLPSRITRHIKRQGGQSAATAANYSQGDGSSQQAYEPYTAWVLDEVKVDLQMGVDLPSTRFGTQRVFVGQCQGLLVRSLAPLSANLAWHLSLRQQASADDVLLVLRYAVVGRALGIPPEHSWVLRDGAGFPAHLIVALRYAAPMDIYLDNALIHLANEVQHFLTRINGGRVHMGTPAMPKSRAEIESAFARYLTKFVHQLPGTTGTGPQDPLREAAAVPASKSVPWWLLDEASQAYFANENVTPTAGAGYQDAMTRLKVLVDTNSLKLNYLDPGRRKVHHFSMPLEVRVSCDLKNGRLPYVYTMYRRYSSEWLKKHPELRGKRFYVLHDPDDLSRAVLLDDDENEVDVLQAEGQWGLFSHNLQVFKIYTRHKHLAMNKGRAYEPPIHMVLERMCETASSNTGTARDLAFVMDYFHRCVTPERLAELGMTRLNWRPVKAAAAPPTGVSSSATKHPQGRPTTPGSRVPLALVSSVRRTAPLAIPRRIA